MARSLKPIRIVEVTPTVQAALYADGDQLGGVQELSSAVRDPENGMHGGVLHSISIVDKASQASALEILFFDESPTLTSSENAALDISDAEMADKCLGSVAIAAADYVALNANSVATVNDLGLILKGANGSTSIYAAIRCGGTPTYTSTSDLVIRYGIEQS
jgi:hypothetical protein